MYLYPTSDARVDIGHGRNEHRVDSDTGIVIMTALFNLKIAWLV